jgi:hypothetical protein
MPKTDKTAYWCTCSDDPMTCLGCGIERLTLQVMGETGLRYLKNRIMPLTKSPTAEGKKK